VFGTSDIMYLRNELYAVQWIFLLFRLLPIPALIGQSDHDMSFSGQTLSRLQNRL
jgi:hypothetical protein